MPQSLTPASWRDAHGFNILCVNDERGEWFVVATADSGRFVDLNNCGIPVGVPFFEPEMIAQLVAHGFSNDEARAAISLAREWVTTVTRRSA